MQNFGVYGRHASGECEKVCRGLLRNDQNKCLNISYIYACTSSGISNFYWKFKRNFPSHIIFILMIVSTLLSPLSYIEREKEILFIVDT